MSISITEISHPMPSAVVEAVPMAKGVLNNLVLPAHFCWFMVDSDIFIEAPILTTKNEAANQYSITMSN